MARYHPSEELLMAYAAGHLEEPLALLVASHMALCPDCRHEVAEFESLGGALLDNLEPAPLDEHALDHLLARLDEPVSEIDIPAKKPISAASDITLPEPLRSYVGEELDRLDWRSRGNVAEVELMPGQPVLKTRLLRIKAGSAIPAHTHEGAEITMVLKGGFSDHQGHYLRGDVCVADNQVEHSPVADSDDDCLCIAITDGALKFTGSVGRWLNLFVRF